MSLESWGDSLPPSKPAAVSSAGNRVDCFAIDSGGRMMQWTARDGVVSPPLPLPGGLNLPASVPCAMVLPDGSFHVFAIAPGGFGSSGGPIAYWRSTDGINWPQLATLLPATAPAGWNGLAVASPAADRIDLFGIGAGGFNHGGPLGHWALSSAGQLLYTEVVAGSDSQLGCSILTAVSPAPNQLDVFAIGPDGLIWHWTGGTTQNSWAGFEKIGPFNFPIAAGSGLAAVAATNGRIELFGTFNGGLHQWSGAPLAFAGTLPGTGPSAYNLPLGTPAAAFVTPQRLEVFAIGPGPLLRWRRDNGGPWIGPVQLDGHPAAGGVGLTVGGGRIDAFTIHAGGSNCLLHWPAGTGGSVQDAQDGINQYWSNWANNQSITPRGHCVPTSFEELIAIVKDADRAGKHVRAVGSSWSFTDIAITPDYLVETNRLNHILTNVLPTALNAGAKGKNLIHVEAGIKLHDLMTELDGAGLAPLTMGGADGQTLAGVLSTSVHGCDFDRGPVCEMLRAIHLIGPSGEEEWIEPTSGITDPTLLRAALGPQVHIVYNDDWFHSAQVTVGTLGIVYAVVLEVLPQHDIASATQTTNWNELRQQLLSGGVFINEGFRAADGTTAVSMLRKLKRVNESDFPLRGFQVAIDPTGPVGNHACFVTTRATAPATAPAPPDTTIAPMISLFWDQTNLLEAVIAGSAAAIISAYILATPLLDGILLSNPATAPLVPVLAAAGTVAVSTIAGIAVLSDTLIGWLRSQGDGAVFDFIGRLLNGHPDVTVKITTGLTSGMLKPGQSRAWAHTVMAPPSDITKLARGLAIEIMYDASNTKYLDAIDDLIKTLDQALSEGLVLGGWFALRFMGQSHAYLSPQQTSRTCSVEFTGIRSLNSTEEVLNRLEASAKRFNAIRHWGMFRDLGADEVARAYPNLDRWLRVRWALTKHGTNHTFDNPFAVRCGLTNAPAPQLVVGFTPGDAAAASVHPAVWPSADGRQELFAVGKSGLDHIWQTTVNGGWSSWFSHGGSLKGSPAICRGGDRSDLMVVGTDGALYHIWQTAANGGWSSWYSHGGAFMYSPAFGQHVSGSLEVFAVGSDGTMSGKRQNGVNSGWSNWVPFGGAFAGAPAAGRSGNTLDFLDVMVVGKDGGLYHKWQTPGGGWSDWYNHGGLLTGTPALARRGTDGALEVMAVGADGHLYHKWQSGPNTGWSSWFDHGGSLAGAPSLALSGQSLEVMVVGTDGALYHMWQTAPGGGWSSWFSHGGAYLGSPFLARRGDGGLEVFVMGKDGNLWHKWQSGPNGGWSNWASHGPLP